MTDSDASFRRTVDSIFSSQHYTMRVAAGAWLALANAAGAESGALSNTASEAESEPGVGLLELSDRLRATSSWAEGAGAVARQISDQLTRSAERSARATERAEELDVKFREIESWRFERAESLPDGRAHMETNRFAEGEKQRLLGEAQQELDDLAAEFAQVIGGTPPSAPEGGAGSGAAPTGVGAAAGGAAGAMAAGGAGGAVASGGGAWGAAGAVTPADHEAPNGSVIGAGSYPSSSVLGPEHGDFAGWVQSPTTGFLVDPATGREFDPVAGRWIDPVTGQPFGEVTEYATRLSGLGNGPGAIASGGGLVAASVGAAGAAGAAAAGAGAAGAASLAGLYGGVVPPSIGNTGPARQQVMRQAVHNLGQRAQVASRFALREAAQGGRPYVPPPAAGGARGTVTRPGAAGTRAPRTAFPGVHGVHGPGRVPHGPVVPGGRALVPPSAAAPPVGATGNGTGRAGTAARAGARAVTEPARTWQARPTDTATRHQLTARPGATPPGPAAGAAARSQARDRDEDQHHHRPTDLTENPEVWSPRRNATRGVLGE
ncbi:hypothetical protein ACTWP5_00810 [Streptomyces sp. 4N509B]|uniref:hypothetical protein n=1 Tax=Streptomyces sp. 4N509B TaxID=3457413 RepID=UPI003FD5C98F